MQENLKSLDEARRYKRVVDTILKTDIDFMDQKTIDDVHLANKTAFLHMLCMLSKMNVLKMDVWPESGKEVEIHVPKFTACFFEISVYE